MRRLFAFVAVCVVSSAACGATPLPATVPSQRLSPAVQANLRRLLPFPEASLAPKIELSVGLRRSANQEAELFRVSADYTAQIVTVRRTLVGGAADADRYRTLGYLYRQAGLPLKSEAAFRRSEGLEKAVLKRRSNDSAALAGYGRTLAASGNPAAAETLLQRATRIAPKSAEVWMALGSVSSAQANPKTEAASHLMRQAAAAYDRAVLLAPADPAVWAARGNFRTWRLPQFQGKLVSSDGLGDYERAAALSPDDSYTQAMVPSTEGAALEMTHHLCTSLKAAKMETLNADRRAETAIQRITAIAQASHGRRSAAAYAARAWVQFEFFYDYKRARRSLRLALRQDPQQRGAIDYQMHVAAVVGDYPLLATACRRELRRRPAVRLRLLLAEADYHLGQQNPNAGRDARRQMERCHAAAPHDGAIRLGLAALLLKTGRAADQARAALLLGGVARPAAPRPPGQQAEYDLTRGVSLALGGDLGAARKLLSLALRDDPKSRPARAALALLPT